MDVAYLRSYSPFATLMHLVFENIKPSKTLKFRQACGTVILDAGGVICCCYGYIIIFPSFSIIQSLNYSSLLYSYWTLLRTTIYLKDQMSSSPLHQIYFLFLYLAKGTLGTGSECVGNTNFIIWQVMSKCLPLY